MTDWVDDERLSREETLERFNALKPEATLSADEQRELERLRRKQRPFWRKVLACSERR